MKQMNRRKFFQNSAIALITAAVAPSALAKKSTCDKAAAKIKKGKFAGYSEDYIKKGKLGYKEKSPAKKAKKGKSCETCKHFCADKGVCTLASMKLKVGKKKYFPKAHPGGYCNMFAWDKAKKKEWKKKNKA